MQRILFNWLLYFRLFSLVPLIDVCNVFIMKTMNNSEIVMINSESKTFINADLLLVAHLTMIRLGDSGALDTCKQIGETNILAVMLA